MLLIYSHTTSARLQYICSFLFTELMGVEYQISIDSEAYRAFEGAKLNYSDRPIDGKGIHIHNHPLLFETGIRQQETDCFTVNGNKAFFKTSTGDQPFDILAASFYLISRYEEYLPFEKDSYGRYAHENSLAFKEGFLSLPLIQIWLNDFKMMLKDRFPEFNFTSQPFSFIPTYDIDIAYAYKYKGIIRNLGGFIKSPSLERIQVLIGSKKDPFDCYAELDEWHQQYDLKPIYFFLVAATNGRYDKNILPHKNSIWHLVKRHARKYTIGLHPSWQSGDDRHLLSSEKIQLEAMAEQAAPIISSRQHYIRFELPHGYQQLEAAGIQHDYSMGYGSINGFRASVAAPFYWYDLQKDRVTDLQIHPFCFMEANSFYEQHYSAEQAYEELMQYYHQCKTYGGTLISIWHNNFLGADKKTQEWKDMYRRFIAQVQQ